MKALLLIGLASLIVACTGRPDSGGFYAYVDAQGNLVTVERTAPSSAAPPAAPLPAEELEELEEHYQTDEEVRALIEQRERDRFVVYRDASGYQVTEPVDLPEARARREHTGHAEPLDPKLTNFIERVEGVPADCCVGALIQRPPLTLDQDALITFRERPRTWVSMPNEHPAVALALPPNTGEIRVISYMRGAQGYLHPQLVFVDQQGRPVLLVDNVFTTRFRETWYRYGYLQGAVPVPDNSRWVVFYLSYAGPSGEGQVALQAGQYPWAEPSSPLAIEGELLIRPVRRAPQ
jgi:hypothetical protein